MGIAVLLLLFLSAFGVWSLRSNLRTGRREARAGVLRNTRVASALASSIASTALSELTAMTTTPALRSGDVPAIRQYISSVTPLSFGFSAGLFWVDPSGQLQARSSPSATGVNLADRAYFREAMAGKRSVSAGLVGRNSGSFILVFAVPSMSLAGVPNGVLGGSVELSAIDSRILKALFGTDAISVYDREHQLIFGPDRRRLGSRMPEELRQVADRHAEGVRPADTLGPSGRRGQVVAFSHVDSARWTVVVEADEHDVFASVEDQYHRSLLVLVGLGAIAFLVAAFGAFRLDAAHRRVLEARARLSAMVERLPAGVVLVDSAKRISLANGAALDSLGAMSNGGGAVSVGAPAPTELLQSIDEGGSDAPAGEIQVEQGGALRTFSVRSTQVRTRRGVAGAVALIDETTDRRAEERRRTAMADLVSALAVADNTPQIARTVSSRAIAAVGCDRCAVVIIDPDSATSTITTDGIDAEWGAALEADLVDDGSALARAIRENRTVDVTRAATHPGIARQVVLPLQSAGRVVGALVVGYSSLEGVLDVATLTGFGAQVGLSVDRARRRQIEHDVSLSLQRTLLTAAPSGSEHLAVAPRYRPSAEQMLVGGDFFDVLGVGDDQTLLVIGDVVGHGLDAATTMAQLKIAIRAFAFENPSPSVILGKLDQFVTSQLESARYTTAVLMLVDTARGRLRYSVAGHPPPLVCGPSGTVQVMETHGEALLGLPPAGGRTEIEVALEPGATAICLYTDGLIERPDLALDEGIEQLAATMAAGDPHSLDLSADRIMEIVDDLPRRDDVALLYAVVRT
jgi:PAS domain-containing protein